MEYCKVQDTYFIKGGNTPTGKQKMSVEVERILGYIKHNSTERVLENIYRVFYIR